MEKCELTLQTTSAVQTQRLGARLAQLLRRGDVVALAGDLGTGKTAFAQGLARGLGITTPVTSPSFTLISQYRPPDGPLMHHVDCYRLSNASSEMWDVGLADLIAGDDIVVIEWADRISDLLPDEYLEVRFTYLGENQRRLCLVAHGTRYRHLLDSLATECYSP